MNSIGFLVVTLFGILGHSMAYALTCHSSHVIRSGSYKECRISTIIKNSEFGDLYHLRLPRERYEKIYDKSEMSEQRCIEFCSNSVLIPIPFDSIYHFPRIFQLEDLVRYQYMLNSTPFHQDIVRYIIETAYNQFSGHRGGTYFYEKEIPLSWLNYEWAYRRQANREIDQFCESIQENLLAQVGRRPLLGIPLETAPPTE